MNKELCTEPAIDVEVVIPDTAEEELEELKNFKFSDEDFLPEELCEGYFNGCDLAFPFEIFPPSDPFGIFDLPDEKDDEEFKKMIDKELKQTWWSELVYKLDQTDWKKVDAKIEEACENLGQFLALIFVVLIKLFASLFIICFAAELAPGLRTYAPSFYFIVDCLLDWFEGIWKVAALPFK